MHCGLWSLLRVASVQHLRIKHYIESPKNQVGSEFRHHLDVSGAPQRNLHLSSLHGGSWRGCSHCCGHCRGRQRGCEGLHGKWHDPRWMAAILAFIGIEFTTTVHNLHRLLGFNPSKTYSHMGHLSEVSMNRTNI